MLEALQSSRFLFILPDKNKSTAQRPYQQVADFAAKLGLEVYMIDIRWKKHNSLLECALEATRKVHELVDELRPTATYFFGFGIGAMVATQVGFLFRANGLLLCSMPPYYQEELSVLPWAQRYSGKKRIYNARNKPSYPNSQISVRTIFVQGEREKRLLNEKVMQVRQSIFKKSQVVVIPKAGPKLRRKVYMAKVKELLETLVSK